VLGPDSEVVALLLAGDQATFAEVVRAWSPAMLRVARSSVHSHATAEDVVQETWLGVLRALDGFAGRAQLRTWVFRILVNTARRHGKREARMNAELAAATVDPARFRGDDDPEWPRHWRDEAVPIETEPEPALLAREFRDVLAAALGELPERQRAVVELRDVHGFDAQEVCELLELTPANQRVLLHRGRARLRAAWEAAAS
jgi:RNA polymerase sigma-70 factor, ECF subfamily